MEVVEVDGGCCGEVFGFGEGVGEGEAEGAEGGGREGNEGCAGKGFAPEVGETVGCAGGGVVVEVFVGWGMSIWSLGGVGEWLGYLCWLLCRFSFDGDSQRIDASDPSAFLPGSDRIPWHLSRDCALWCKS